MSYAFHAVDVSTFDVNIALEPLLVPQAEAVQAPLWFLVNPQGYQKQYEKGVIVKTDSFRIRPLTKWILERNHFWHGYRQLCFASTLSAWNLQLPFVCKPLPTAAIRVDTSRLGPLAEGVQVKAGVSVLLSALGWSNLLRIRLEGKVPAEHLPELLRKLRDLDTQPFLFGGRPCSLPEIFKQLTRIIKNEIYSREKPPASLLPVRQHRVVSILDFEGQPKAFRWPVRGAMKMNDAEEALMHGIIYARPVCSEEAREQKVTVTRYDGTCFALTEFDHGTLLFMQELRARQGHAALKCLGANLRHCTLTLLTRHWFYKYAALPNWRSPLVEEMRKDARTVLELLPEFYRNPFCRNFCEHHSSIKRDAAA